MTGRGICLVVFGLAVYSGLRNAEAITFVHDQFLEDGPLEPKVPMPGPGVAWSGGGGTETPIQVVGGKAVLIQTDEGINGRESSNVFMVQTGTATTYARFDFSLPAGDNVGLATDADVAAEGAVFTSLRGSGASELRGRVGVLPPAAGGGFRLGMNADDSDLTMGAAWATDLAFDTTYRVVVSYNAANAVSKLWLNPADEMSASIMHTGMITGTLIDRITLRQADDYAGKQLIDNVVVASSFAEALGGVALGVPGDYNNTGSVDAADYVVWRKAQADGATTLDNRDPLQAGNPVGGADYDYWRARFGNPGSAAGNVVPNAVPEPATVLLLLIGLAICRPRRRVVVRLSTAI